MDIQSQKPHNFSEWNYLKIYFSRMQFGGSVYITHINTCTILDDMIISARVKCLFPLRYLWTDE